MLTRWGRSLDRNAVLDDYPRPQMVRDVWTNLNGPWQYAITPKTAPQPVGWEDEILVPFCAESRLSGVERTLSPLERLWYRRIFPVGETAANDQRTLLHFGAVDHECAIWINGGLAGTHTGGFDPFTLDITDHVRSGDNEIIVGVTDPTSSGDQPRGKQHLKPQGIWYTPVTGIWQTVWHEHVPLEAHIEEISIVPTSSCDGIEFTGFLHRPSRDPELALRVSVRLGDKIANEVTVRPDRKVVVPISDPVLWSPDTPTLYDVEVTLLRIRNPLPEDNDQQAVAQLQRHVPLRGETEARLYAEADLSGAKVIDRVTGYFGLRRIELGPHPERGHPTLLLNDEPVFHLGPLDQGWWPDGLHTPPSDDAMIYEIEYLKAAGFNTLRKHIKVEPARYYYHCDRLGMLVWQDMPSGFLPAQFVAPNDEGEALRSSRATEAYELELQRMINRLKAHPSIVIWVLHNEGWGQFDSDRLTQRIRSLDPTRLINATSGWRDMGVGDLIDKHDYQSEPTAPTGDGKRALVIGEYGGIGWPLDDHLWNPEMRNWGYQTFHSVDEVQAAYRKVTEAIINMHRTQGLSGAIYTQTTDVEGEVNGLITYDREVEKYSREWLAAVHAPLTDPDVL
jgi:beta-galactosidase/beta-glucuronidase